MLRYSNKKYVFLILAFITLLTYIKFPNNAYGSTINFTGTTSSALQTAINNATSGDTIIITKDITIANDERILIPSGKTITLTDNNSTVKLWKHIRDQDESTGLFSIGAGATLIIKGTGYNTFVLDGGGKHWANYDLINIQSGGTLNMYDGVIITNSENTQYSGGAITIGTSSVFNMYGGVITGITASGSGAVNVQRYGTFNMYGGVIKDNSNVMTSGTFAGGAGVWMDSFDTVFNMHGGKIINNFSYYKGAEGYYSLRVGSRSGVFNHNGGIIADTYILITGIVLSGSSTVNIGSTIPLTANISPTNVSDKTLLWYSSNPNIATVNNGIITGIKSGTVTITAVANDGSGVTAYKTIEVKSSITGITIEGNSTVEKGNVISLKATIIPENAGNKNLTWKSSDSSVASVEGFGASAIIRGIKKGTVTISVTAQDGSGVTANKIITVTSNFEQGEAKYILVDDIIEYQTGYSDIENDPKYRDEYRYIHNPSALNGVALDNTMGYVSYHNSWQSNMYTSFSKVGTYEIQYRIQDNPPTAANNNNFANYRYYSDVAESTIYVHRKPIAMYTISGSTVIDNSYDLDHSVSHPTKGLDLWEWQYINSNGYTWSGTYGTAPGVWGTKQEGIDTVNYLIWLYSGVPYKIILRVRDIEGTWSEPTIKSAGEYSKPIANFAIEKNTLIYPDTQTITDLSYDTNGLALTYQWTVYKGGTTIITSSNKDISSSLNSKITSLFPNVTGTYAVSLKVINSAGVESNTITKNFEIVVYNQAPTADFDLVSNESPAWTFPKILGLHTLRYRPTNSLFFEEKTKFNVNVTDPNTDNLGFGFNWKLERFAVNDINNISGVATNTYSYTTQFPFVNSFKVQGLQWGAYRITLNVTDKPPVPPYKSTDAKTVSVTKNYYIIPELSLSASFESTSSEIIVGDIIKLKAKTNKMTENVNCVFADTNYALGKISEDSNFAYWEKNITIPDSITESGTYQLQFVGSTAYGGNGNITREIKDIVPIDIVALKLINFRIIDIVNHPDISFPYTKNMLINELIKYKAGYYVTFQIDSKGKPNNVYSRIDISNNGSIDNVINMTKISAGDTETWQGKFYTSAYLTPGTIISIKLDCLKGFTTYNYNIKENWDGRSLIVNGSALQDGRVNLTN